MSASEFKIDIVDVESEVQSPSLHGSITATPPPSNDANIQAVFNIPPTLIHGLQSSIDALSTYITQQSLQNYPLQLVITDLQSNLQKLQKFNRTFHPFPKLPIELRLKVWKLAASVPQIIGVRESKKNPGYLAPATEGCPILSACKEARKEALRIRLPFYRDEEAPKIYANLEVDTLWLMGSGWKMLECQIPACLPLWLQQRHTGRFEDIQKLAVNLPLNDWVSFDFAAFSRFNIKELIMNASNIDNEAAPVEQRRLAFVEPRESVQDVVDQPYFSYVWSGNANDITTWGHLEDVLDFCIQGDIEYHATTIDHVRNIFVQYDAENIAEMIRQRGLHPDMESWTPPAVKIMDMIHEDELL